MVVLILIALILCKRIVSTFPEDKKSLVVLVLVLLVLVVRICVQCGLPQRLMPCSRLSGSSIVCVVWVVASNVELLLLTQVAKETMTQCRLARLAGQHHYQCSDDNLFGAVVFSALALFLNGASHVHLILSPCRRWPSAALLTIVFVLSLALERGQGQVGHEWGRGGGSFAHENVTSPGMHGGHADHAPFATPYRGPVSTSLAALAVLICGMLVAAVHEGAMRASYARQRAEAACLSLRNAQLTREKERLHWDVRLAEHKEEQAAREQAAWEQAAACFLPLELSRERTASDPPFSHHSAKVGGAFCPYSEAHVPDFESAAQESGAGAQGATLLPPPPPPQPPAAAASRSRWFRWPASGSAPAACSAIGLSNLPDRRGEVASSAPARLARL